MYPRTHRYKPEQLEVLKLRYLEEKEYRIRTGRVKKLLEESKKQGDKIPTPELEERLKYFWRIEAEPLSPEEQKELAVFEKKMIIEMSYGNNLDLNDI